MNETDPYETAVDRYDSWFDEHIPAYQTELNAVKELLPENKKGIEVGVGTGRFAAPLGITIGIDPSKEMSSMAKMRGINIIRGVAESLPVKNNSIDFLLMVTVICFLKDLKSSFREALRVLRPDGSIIIGFIDKKSSIGRSYEKKKQGSVFYSPAKFRSVNEVKNLLEKTGFSDFSTVQTLFNKPEEIKKQEQFIKGYGKGSFVVIRGIKQ